MRPWMRQFIKSLALRFRESEAARQHLAPDPGDNKGAKAIALARQLLMQARAFGRSEDDELVIDWIQLEPVSESSLNKGRPRCRTY